MYKKIICCLLAVAMVLVSGGVELILPVYADLIPSAGIGGSETITMMQDFADDAVMVVLTHEASLQFVDYTPEDFQEIECVEVQDLSTGAGAQVQAILSGEQLETDSIGARYMNQNIDVDGYYKILYLKLANPSKGNVLRAVAELEQREDVYSVEPDYIYQVDIPVEAQSANSQNVPVFGWGAEKIEQETAWEIETGSNSICVGVLDSGIDKTHPELSGRINLISTADFVTDDNYTATQDPLGHGTHVAGIIGAKYDNDAINFSGICVSGGRLNAYNTITSKILHSDVSYASINGTYHRVSCNDCDATWQEAHTERPGVEVCIHCQEYLW